MATHLAKIDVALYLRDKRARKQARRKQREWKVEFNKQEHDRELRSRFGPRSKIVAMLASGAPSVEVQRNHRVRFQLPGTFSVIDRPELALAAISDFASELRAYRLGNIFLDFTKVTRQDLGANGLLDVLVDELSTQARRTGRRIRWRGTYPTAPSDRRFVQAMGVIKRLQIEHEYLPPDQAASLELFEARCKHYTRSMKATQADMKSRVTQRFADHVNRCLGRVGRKLTPGSRSRMCQYVSEIIDNAEEHGAMGDWSIQGYLDTSMQVPMCEIAIFNFGRTIAESFQDLPQTSYPRQQVQRYIDLHQKGGFFERDWRREDLYTLIALQGGVSTKNRSDTDTRGNGTVDLISFFQRVHKECSTQADGLGATMAITSGSTFILFDGTYEMQPNAVGKSIMAFNQGNDLESRPDRKYVRALDGASFPGTMICIKFPLPTASSIPTTNGGQP